MRIASYPDSLVYGIRSLIKRALSLHMPAALPNVKRLLIIIGVLLSVLFIGLGAFFVLTDSNFGYVSNEISTDTITDSDFLPPDEFVSPSLQAELPFDTNMFATGYQLGSITISLNELISLHTLLHPDQPATLGSLAEWQESANALRNNVVVIESAIAAGFQPQLTNGKVWYSFQVYQEATSFLNSLNASQGKSTDFSSLIQNYPELTMTLQMPQDK